MVVDMKHTPSEDRSFLVFGMPVIYKVVYLLIFSE